MRLIVLPVLIVLLGFELVALVKLIQKFRSPYLTLGVVLLLFAVNSLLFIALAKYRAS